MVGQLIGTRDEPTSTILINGQSIKLPSKCVFLYPLITAIPSNRLAFLCAVDGS